MLSGIDHVVVLVRELAGAVAAYEALGFTVTPGGEHTGGATHNALIGFDDGCYFELIAFKAPDRHHDHRWWARLAKGEGLVDYALRADNAEAVVEEVRSRGLELAKPVDGRRTRPDGVQLAWRSVTSGRSIGTSALPFAIEDVTPRTDRVPNGEAATHRLGVTGVAELVIAVRDVEASAVELSTMLGSKQEEAPPRFGDAGLEAVFTTGAQRLRLVQPGPATPHDGAGMSLAERLESWGEGAYEVVLAAGAGSNAKPGTLLPADAANGARIRIGLP